MWKFHAALGLLILSTSSALANCNQTTNVPLLSAALPIPADATDAAMASLALPYAAMIAFVPTNEAPAGFQRGPGPTDLLNEGNQVLTALSGFNAATFVSCSGEAVVIAFDGLRDFDLRDYISGALRRAGGGYSTLAFDFTAAVLAAFPGYDVSVIGHSAGGNLASYVAGAFSLPSITFNASRTEASLAWNDGSRQLNVIVRGDPIADGSPSLPGVALYLDVEGERRHPLNVVLAGLAAEAGG